MDTEIYSAILMNRFQNRILRGCMTGWEGVQIQYKCKFIRSQDTIIFYLSTNKIKCSWSNLDTLENFIHADNNSDFSALFALHQFTIHRLRTTTTTSSSSATPTHAASNHSITSCILQPTYWMHFIVQLIKNHDFFPSQGMVIDEWKWPKLEPWCKIKMASIQQRIRF